MPSDQVTREMDGLTYPWGRAMNAPALTTEQRAAYERGVAMANAVPEPSHHDGRIALDDVVSFRCPPFLTTDYDPTHRANIR